MRRVIVSTVGTSLLTNQIIRSAPSEKDWYNQLRDTANFTAQQMPEEILEILEILQKRATQKLNQSSTTIIRSASAELNGIYGLYQEQLERGSQDMHWLIATDTIQGLITAQVVELFLQSKGLIAQIYTPKGLSTANTRSFAEGVDDLLTQLRPMTEGYDKVCFNLVGGFKSLQAYLNTIGMFYADEIIYIFEGANSEIITIPRLPIKIDETTIKPYATQFALMAAGAEVKRSELLGIQETLIYAVEDEVILSNWGKLVWNQAKNQILSGDLLTLPRVHYEESFKKDYRDISDEKQSIKLQEVLAKISSLLVKYSGDTAYLKGDGGVLYEVYVNKGGIAHFRVTQGLRVSCIAEGGNLKLRHYGSHDYVNNNP
ncbi:putative CRISPR-associated protein [Anthocerotibacter panamensis]|uniref:putative CRISPR-associated protein n=1 Tax=Anthocerotibacter panamensis TaxID=2857077 RepID=UPI001C4015DC|nr:putative CRISPR-associated protein [Anthocerotibacter panamensis]